MSVVGEISGTVTNYNDGEEKGLGRIIVNIINAKGKIVAKILTEQDGYFTYIGLIPGLYTISLDADQMRKLE